MFGRVSRVLKGIYLDRKLHRLSMEERFSHHYRSGWWFANGESRSGSGSTLEATTSIRNALVPFLEKWEVKRFLDAPCGDWNWMKSVPLPEEMRYIGADIVPELISSLHDAYTKENLEFLHLDITCDRLPSADMMMCRDALFHLSSNDIWRFFDNFLTSDISFLLTTHMPQIVSNREIVTGLHRPLNLEAAPFFLGEPIDSFADFTPPRREKYMALWTRDQIAQAVNSAKA